LIRIAQTEEDLRRTFPVMVQLRPHFDLPTYLAQVERQRKNTGYQVALVEDLGRVVAVAGFRIQEMLFAGKHLYVDDLVTDSAERSRGHGRRLLQWLLELARQNGCRELQLDSGVQRHEAHRFYFREGMHVSSYHFRLKLREA
jgi:GNAT superfamily N-acetyltransferase